MKDTQSQNSSNAHHTNRNNKNNLVLDDRVALTASYLWNSIDTTDQDNEYATTTVPTTPLKQLEPCTSFAEPLKYLSCLMMRVQTSMVRRPKIERAMICETWLARMMSLPMLLLLAVATSVVPALERVLVCISSQSDNMDHEINISESKTKVLILDQDRYDIPWNEDLSMLAQCKTRKLTSLDNSSVEIGILYI